MRKDFYIHKFEIAADHYNTVLDLIRQKYKTQKTQRLMAEFQNKSLIADKKKIDCEDMYVCIMKRMKQT